MPRSTGLSSAAEGQASTLRRESPVRGFLYIGTAALLWGLSASMGRAAFTGRMLPRSGIRDVTPLILTQCRTGFSFIAVAIAMTFRRGIKRLYVPRFDFLKLVLLGLGGVAASNYFYYLAIQRT